MHPYISTDVSGRPRSFIRRVRVFSPDLQVRKFSVRFHLQQGFPIDVADRSIEWYHRKWYQCKWLLSCNCTLPVVRMAQFPTTPTAFEMYDPFGGDFPLRRPLDDFPFWCDV